MEQNGERETGKTALCDSPDLRRLTNDFDKNKTVVRRGFRLIYGQNAPSEYQWLSLAKQNQNGPESALTDPARTTRWRASHG